MGEVTVNGMNAATIWTATGTGAALIFIIWYMMREGGMKDSRASKLEKEKNEAVRMLHENQLHMIEVFNANIKSIDALVETQKRNNELLVEIKCAIVNGK